MSVIFRKPEIFLPRLISVRVAFLCIIVIHFFGALGLSYPLTRPYFELATPLNLLITSTLVFSLHQQWNASFLVFAFLSFLIGFLVEVVGVHTGIIFGEYQYGPILGPQLWDVPVLIGLNWLLLIYCSGLIASQVSNNLLSRSIVGSILMVLLDLFIEPVAVELNFWRWNSEQIPVQNYLGWLITAFLLQLIFHTSKFEKQNSLGKYVFYVQLGFFIFLQSLI